MKPGLILPDWLPVEEWAAFLANRRMMRVPNSERAQQMLLKKLAHLKTQGYDVKIILDEAYLRGWTSLFPVKEALPEIRRQHESNFGQPYRPNDAWMMYRRPQ